MAADKVSMEERGIEERLIDQVGDAIGGEGSVSLVSGGSAAERHALVGRVLEEAEGMGCIVASTDFSRSGRNEGSISSALAMLGCDPAACDPGRATAEEVSLIERSYHSEMVALNFVRKITRESTAVIVAEEIGMADTASLAMFCFLARNLSGSNVLMIATHPSAEEDRVLAEKMGPVRAEALVHDMHFHGEVSGTGDDGVQVEHLHSTIASTEISSLDSEHTSQIVDHLVSSFQALSSGDPTTATSEARSAKEGAQAIGHYGLLQDSFLALGAALTHAGSETEALSSLDRAITLAFELGELRSQLAARIRKAELLLFSIGEPDSASSEAASALELSHLIEEDGIRIEPLALLSLIEARSGRKDRGEQYFCDASAMLNDKPEDAFILERMILAVSAAALLESRNDLAGMNARFSEALILSSGTEYADYWTAVVSLQHGLALLRLRRPREAKSHLDAAAIMFGDIGNAVQAGRSGRAAVNSETGIVLD